VAEVVEEEDKCECGMPDAGCQDAGDNFRN